MAYLGSSLILQQEVTPAGGTYATIGGMQNHTIDINNAIVDVTTKDSAGVRQLLNAKALQSISISGDGVVKDDATLKKLRDSALASTQYNFRLTTCGDSTAAVTFTGAFTITNFKEDGKYDAESRFSCTLESAGTITVASVS